MRCDVDNVCFVFSEMELENKSDILFIAPGLMLCTRVMCHSGKTSRLGGQHRFYCFNHS